MAESSRPCPSCATPVPLDAVSCPACGALSLPGPDADATIAGRLARALAQRYRVERELGRGGMAIVFLAHDLRHDRPVAIKVLLPELSRFLGLERFLREIHIAAQLNHPHILTLHDSGEADGLLFYVMPYVEGDSLRRRLAREGALPVAEAVRVAAEVAEGLAYAHHHGVVHRDIKPENILLTEGHALVADFGIARALAGAGGTATITSTGISLGTPAYMSPEQASGAAVDHRTDLYALGCTLFEMLTGRPPYPGPTPQALVVQHLADPVPSARALRHEVPAALDAAVRRAMAKTPDDRFQEAADLATALGATAPATGTAVGLRRPGRPGRRRVAVAAVGVVAVAVAAALLLRGLGGRHGAPSATSTPLRVVVQPFRERAPDLRGAADRVTEALTTSLQPVPALAVTAYAVVADLRAASLDTLRARFAPDRFVVGGVDAAGADLRVTTQLVDAHTGRALADTAVTVRQGAGTPAAAAAPLSAFVRRALWSELDEQARRGRVHDAAAWALVERARELEDAAGRAVTERLDRAGFRSLDVADSLLQEARKRDGASDLIPIALARVADRRAFFSEYLVQAGAPPAELPGVVAERRRALAILDPLIRARRGPADAFELRGSVKEGLYRALGADSLLEGAIADYRSATELDLHSATAWRALSSALMSAGRYAEALLALEHASEEDVFQIDRLDLLRSRFDAARSAEQYDVAAEACREGQAEARDDQRFRDCDLELWSRTRGDRRSAALAVARAESLNAGETVALMIPIHRLWAAEVLARAGLGDSADQLGRRALAGASKAWLPLLSTEAAYLRVLRHQPDSAIALLGEAARLDPVERAFIRNAAEFRTLRQDPRFAAAVGTESTPP